jgi:uncharacterized glyoxalase superfamily protein PhnB
VALSFRAFGAHYGGWLVAAFDSIPESRYGYKPMPVQLSVGYIAQHVADANDQLCAELGPDKPVLTAKDSLADTVRAKWPKDTLVARLRASLAFCDAAIAKLTDADLAMTAPARSVGSGRSIVRARYLSAYITDLAEHYAQISSYMRLLGMVPPSALPRPPRRGIHNMPNGTPEFSPPRTLETRPLHGESLGASLTVKDLERSLGWYCDVVGFAVDRRHERNGKLVAVSLSAGDVRLLINQDDGARGWDRVKGEGFSLQITTADDVDAIAVRIKQRGGMLATEPTDMPWGARVIRLQDPDGFKLVISQPKPGGTP